MKPYKQLLLENKAWAAERKAENPDFFTDLAKEQTPNFLWIGCSDSRVSPTEITQTEPGEIFIHRNVANLVVHTDFNLLSVLQYAVEVLKIEHIIVCGHYGCGGVKAAMGNLSYGIIDKWLRHIKDVYQLHRNEIDAFPTEEERLNKLVEWNVREQLLNVAKTNIVQKSWKKNKRPHLHGWIYNLGEGVINPVLEIEPNHTFDLPIFQYSNLPEF